MSTFQQSSPRAPYTHALRVTCAYDATTIRVVSVKRVAMRVPAVATELPDDKSFGYWFEVRDSAGNLLYHRPVHDPMHRNIEIFGDHAGEPLRQVPAVSSSGQFELLIPDLPNAAEFVLKGPALVAPRKKGPAPASVLLRHAHSELRRMSTAAGSPSPGTKGKTP